ncbi:DMT family transporter [Caenimonas aquaedulcis]|uniref:DMT family transporter n=1 Tax=Caenimonas aquaedulcis TaxID=2793270 RepID=A0A931H3Q7_9BURK|nr:DMT family transporter [Caenimonas aquaedulcis]MBG9388004.1 DMT family transporter [Caenimonas aquaedulcis]
MQAFWMIIASLLFTLMGVCIKFAATAFTSAELIFYRGLIGAILMWGFARIEGVSLRTRMLPMHAWRSVIGVVALGMWFYAIAYLPLATANSLNYMSSIWIAVFVVAGTLLTWTPQSGRPLAQATLILSVLAGFAGVVLLLQPELSSDQLFAGVIGFLSSIAAALAYLQVAALSKAGEPESRTVFYFALGCVVGGAVWMAMTGVSPWSWRQSVWLLPIGMLAALGQWCMTRAYGDTGGAHGSATLVVANLQYSGILFSAAFGYLLFDDRITLMGWSGIALIIASGIVSTIIRIRSFAGSPGEER